jgi:LysM repeat protein
VLNILLLFVVAAVVLYPSRSTTIAQPVSTVTDSEATVAPVDQLASVSIALTVARMTNLPEAAAVANQADSENIELSLASANDTIVDKPQSVVSAFVSNKDIHTYIAKAGDSVASVAASFGVTSNSILWSNNLADNILSAGQKLYIPPVNGIVYTVKSGDTAATLAAKFHADQTQITDDNDAEIGGLQAGEQIIIPNGTITPVISSYSYGGFAWGSNAIYGFNGYDVGECTWYVATQIAVPANWGNADTWAEGARAAGWHVSPIPSVGAIAQTSYAAGGLGHVGIVVAINGGQVEIKDMNDYGDGGGYDRVGEGWVPISAYQNYITAP